MPAPLTVTLYGRPGCHLCENAADLLDDLRPDFDFSVVEVNIMSDLDLHRRYWDKIPVVQVGVMEVHAPIDPVRLRQAIAFATRANA